MKRAAFTLTIALLLATPLVAQSAKKGKAPAPAPAQVSVSQVNDRRSTDSFAELTLRLELKGIDSKEVSATRVFVREATDETGRDLVDHSQSEPPLSPNMRGQYGGDDPSPMTVDVSLRSPDRGAATLKSVSGDIELHMPGRDPDSVVMIPKYQAGAGKPLVNKGLKANGVEITIVTPAMLAADKKKGAEKKRAEAKAEGNDEDTIKYIVSSFEESFYAPGESDTVLRVKDPNKRIQEFAFVTPGQEPQRAFTSDEQGYTVLSSYGSAPAADTGLRITLQTPKSVVRQSFALQNVGLP